MKTSESPYEIDPQKHSPHQAAAVASLTVARIIIIIIIFFFFFFFRGTPTPRRAISPSRTVLASLGKFSP